MTFFKTMISILALLLMALPACSNIPAAASEGSPIVFRIEVPEGTEGAVVARGLHGTNDLAWFGDAQEFPLGYAGPTLSSTGSHAVAFEIVAHKQEAFAAFTEANIGKRMAIEIDGEILAAPTIASRLPGAGVMEGGAEGFSQERVEELVQYLRVNG